MHRMARLVDLYKCERAECVEALSLWLLEVYVLLMMVIITQARANAHAAVAKAPGQFVDCLRLIELSDRGLGHRNQIRLS